MNNKMKENTCTDLDSWRLVNDKIYARGIETLGKSNIEDAVNYILQQGRTYRKEKEKVYFTSVAAPIDA